VTVPFCLLSRRAGGGGGPGQTRIATTPA